MPTTRTTTTTTSMAAVWELYGSSYMEAVWQQWQQHGSSNMKWQQYDSGRAVGLVVATVHDRVSTVVGSSRVVVGAVLIGW
jgi:hypothetical protein